MHRRALLVGGWAWLATLVLAGCATQPVRDAARVVEPAVVSVVGRGNEAAGLGSGFYVGPDRLVTCLHCVDGRDDVRVRLGDGRQVQALGVLAEDRAHDLALLALEPLVPQPRPLPVSDAPVEAGTALTAVGSYLGRAQTAVPVVVSRAERARKRIGTAFGVKGEVGPGLSGGPLLDADGRVRGVLAERDPSAAATGLVVPGRFVNALSAGALEPMAAYGARTARNPELALKRGYEAALLRFHGGDVEGGRVGAERVYAQGRGLDSVYPWAALGLATQALEQQGRAGEAEALLRRAGAESPGRAAPVLQLGHLLWNHGRREEALASFAEAVRREPSSAEAQATLASRLSASGRAREAEAPARAALRLEPTSLEGRLALGVALGSQGRNAEALVPLEAALRSAPDSLEARTNLGSVLANLGRRAEARTHLEAVLRADPTVALAHEDLARIAVAERDFPAARRARDRLAPLDAAAAREITTLIEQEERGAAPAAAERRVPPPTAATPAAPPAPPGTLPRPASTRVR